MIYTVHIGRDRDRNTNECDAYVQFESARLRALNLIAAEKYGAYAEVRHGDLIMWDSENGLRAEHQSAITVGGGPD